MNISAYVQNADDDVVDDVDEMCLFNPFSVVKFSNISQANDFLDQVSQLIFFIKLQLLKYNSSFFLFIVILNAYTILWNLLYIST